MLGGVPYKFSKLSNNIADGNNASKLFFYDIYALDAVNNYIGLP